MAKDNTVGYIYETTDYHKFKRLEGNRADIDRRAKKVIKSVKAVGQIKAPIIVNEQFQIVDGQARAEAFERLGLPIYYTIVHGIGRDECIAMNINQTSWTIMNYIQSYAELGNVSYMYLLNLYRTYGKLFQSKVIICSITGRIDMQSSRIRNEDIVCSSTDYNRAVNMLSWLENYRPFFKHVKGHTEFYYLALMFCYEDKEVDKNRLYQKIEQMQASLIPVTNSMQAFDVIENIYNNRARGHVYIKTNYRRALEDKYPWYGNKWGANYEEDK